MERWLSGRRRLIGNQVYGQPYRRFKSSSLRHIKTSLLPFAKGLFFVLWQKPNSFFLCKDLFLCFKKSNIEITWRFAIPSRFHAPFKSSSLRHEDTHERSVKTLSCVSFSLSFIRFKGFLYPFFFLIQYGCRFLPTRYLTQELSNHRTISNFYNLCTKSSVRVRIHKKIIAPLHS